VQAGTLTVPENADRPYLKWLGILFDRKLTFKYYVQAQTAKAIKTARAFAALQTPSVASQPPSYAKP
jgi:hypothetical protein